MAGIVKCSCGKPMYVFSTAKKFTCKACKNSIGEEVMNEIYQAHLKQYLNDISPKMFIDEMDAELKEKNCCFHLPSRSEHNFVRRWIIG